jgi:hypothetical protein
MGVRTAALAASAIAISAVIGVSVNSDVTPNAPTLGQFGEPPSGTTTTTDPTTPKSPLSIKGDTE